MVAELGQTTDPKQLIPGEPGRISTDLRSAAGNMRTIDGVGGELSKIDPAQWTGRAGDRFRSAFGQEPPKWIHAMQRLSRGGQALADYGDTLTWGQDQAQHAIEQYTKAQAASRLAAAQYNAHAQGALAGGTPPGGMPPFDDPSTKAIREAQQILEHARERLGGVAGQVVSQLAGDSDGGGKSTYKGSLDGDEKKFGNADDDSRYRRDGKAGYSKDNSGGKFLADRVGITGPEKTVAEAKAGVDVAHGKLGGKFGSDATGGSGDIKGSVLGAGADAKVTAGPGGATVAASAEAYLAKGSADGELHAGPAKLQGHGEAEVGAKADGKVHLGPTGVAADGEAFAGAKASGEANASVAGVGAGAHGEAWAGVGVEGQAQLGLGDDGKFHVGASGGAALGVGGKLGFDVTVDPKEVTDTVSDAADDVGHAAHAVGDGAKAVGHGAKSAFDGVKSLL